MVGQAVFRLKTQSNKKSRLRFPFRSRKPDQDPDADDWTCLISRSLLYRIDPTSRSPGAQSGTAICIHEEAEDHISTAKIAGFSSWVQPVSDITRYDLDDNKIYNRLLDGRVAFYGAFQAPAKLREKHTILR
jgi:hypothetical protein